MVDLDKASLDEISAELRRRRQALEAVLQKSEILRIRDSKYSQAEFSYVMASEAVCIHTGISASALRKKDRRQAVVDTRCLVAAALCHSGFNDGEVAQLLHIDRSTVVYYRDRCAELRRAKFGTRFNVSNAYDAALKAIKDVQEGRK